MSPQTNLPPAPPAKSGSKKWIFLGCGGCLVLVIIAAIVAGVMGVGFFKGIMGMVKSSDAYKAALAEVQNSAEVQAAIGSPITEGPIAGGSVNTTNGETSADLMIQVKGPNGDAMVHAVGRSVGGSTTFTTLEVTVPATGKVIDLAPKGGELAPPPAPAPAPAPGTPPGVQ